MFLFFEWDSFGLSLCEEWQQLSSTVKYICNNEMSFWGDFSSPEDIKMFKAFGFFVQGSANSSFLEIRNAHIVYINKLSGMDYRDHRGTRLKSLRSFTTTNCTFFSPFRSFFWTQNNSRVGLWKAKRLIFVVSLPNKLWIIFPRYSLLLSLQRNFRNFIFMPSSLFIYFFSHKT